MEKAALTLAAAAVSPLMIRLGNKAASNFGGDITQEELQNLKTIILPKIRTVTEAAETIQTENLRPWLMKLKDVAYDAEDVLDAYEYENIKSKVSPPPTSLKKFTSKAKEFLAPALLKTDLKKSLEKLKQSAEEADKLVPLIDIVHKTATQRYTLNQRHTTVASLSSPVFGRDKELDMLINMLINEPNRSSDENNILIYAIYGLGGAGKTTLAQYIYNHQRVDGHFDMKIWVHLTHNLDVHKVTREIMESAVQGECNHIDNLNVLQTRLKEILKSNKCLLVLDDVWWEEREQWERLLIPLNEVGDVRSRILITTRMEGVASKLGIRNIVPLQELKAEDCWSILKHYAFGNANKAIEDTVLADTGKQIVNRMKNSPLAARMVGCLLSKKMKVDEWKMVLKQDMLSETIDALLLSFQHLPPHLQRCFAFCSLYKKSVRFDSIELVRFWIAQGFIEVSSEDEMTAEDKGMLYFNDLVSYSFFQLHQTRNGRNVYVMHDLLHDLAEKVSKNHCFRIEDGTVSSPATTVIHLSIASTDNLAMHIPDIYKLENLRTFIVFSVSKVGFDNIMKCAKKMFQKLTKLRVLHFGDGSMQELNSSVGELKHLRYLQLSQVKKLPETLGELYHLQFLLLSKCTSVDGVPKSLNNLINLRCLLGVQNIFSTIPGFGKLTSLQTLEVYPANRNRECSIGQLKNLDQLRGSLSIQFLENVKDEAEASEAMLKHKKHLEELKLEFGHFISGRDSKDDEEVLQGLEPPPNLRKLEIHRYKGVETPKWMLKDQCISNLHSLKLSICTNWKSLPPIGQLPFLSSLHIESMHSVKKINPTFYGSGCSISFPRLQMLKLSNILKLKHWAGVEGVELFPCLRELEILRCPMLRELPFVPSSLKKLKVWNCSTLIKVPSLPYGLNKLEVHHCRKLVQLSPFPCSLEELDINHCPGIGTLLSSISCNNEEEERPLHLNKLMIVDCSILDERTLNASLYKFDSLTELKVQKLPTITSFILSSNLALLRVLHINGCNNLRSLEGIGSIPFLQELEIEQCSRLMKMESMQSDGEDDSAILPSSMKSIKIKDCDDIDGNLLRRSLLGLTSLSSLSISGFVDSFVDLSDLIALKQLDIRCCPELTGIWNLQQLASLLELTVLRCPKLTTGRGVRTGNLSSLKWLKIDEPLLLGVFLKEEGLNFLKELEIFTSSQDTPFSPHQENMFRCLTSLKYLTFENCKNLPSLPSNLESLSSLVRLCIWKCPKIESLPSLPSSLQSLATMRCDPQLVEKYGKNGSLRHKIDRIPRLRVD